MHYEEEDHRNHPERRHHDYRRGRPRHEEGPENFNDFRSRWDEPVPPLQRFRDDELNERRRFRNERGTWNQQRPYPEQRHYPDHERDYYEHWNRNRYRQQDPERQHWQRREEDNFNPNNQHASDRWRQDDFILREEELRRRFNRQFRDWDEHDRRRS